MLNSIGPKTLRNTSKKFSSTTKTVIKFTATDGHWFVEKL